LSLYDKILRRRSHYRAIFQPSPSRDAVLADLRRFCRMDKVPRVTDMQGRTDIYATGIEAGRQEVFQRIVGHLNIDDAQLLQLKEQAHDD
jgi:hypothetical protein